MNGLVLAVLAGAGVVAGMVLAVVAVRPAYPALGEALARLDPSSARQLIAAAAADRPADPVAGLSWQRWRALLMASARRLPFVQLPTHDLALLGMSADGFLWSKVTAGLAGLAIGPVQALLWSLLGLGLPIPVLVGFSAAAGWVAFNYPDRQLRGRAARARRQVREAVSAFLDLVALGKRANLGPVDALNEAAVTGHGWAFGQIRAALDWAQNHQLMPWDGLQHLADRARIDELADVAAIARDSQGGGAVFETLQARSAAIRESLLAAEKTRANVASQRMTYVGMGFAACFLVFLLYGAITRIVST